MAIMRGSTAATADDEVIRRSVDHVMPSRVPTCLTNDKCSDNCLGSECRRYYPVASDLLNLDWTT